MKGKIKKLFMYLSILMVALLVTGCPEKPDDPADPAPPSLVKTTNIPTGGSACAYGGILVESGIDDNLNSVLDQSEVDKSEMVCHGNNGMNSLVLITDELSGNNCVNGGQKIESGVDDNGDGVLDPDEVENTSYVCNGENGREGEDGDDGTNGLASLISITDEPSGANCVTGGKKVDVGLDDNSDGSLDPGEVDNSWYVCNGADGNNGTDGLTNLIAITDESSGVNCEYGGKKVDVGLDDNSNSLLEFDEIDDTHYVCNGEPGVPDGLNSLISITEEVAGSNCQNGGIKVEVGLDDDRDGLLDIPDEVDDTAYVCNGQGDGYYSVGGSVSGLSGTLTLQINDDEEVVMSSDGAFTFPTPLNNSAGYDVVASSQPVSQTCTVVYGSGTIPGANVTGILVFCSVDTYIVGGNVTGLDSGKIVTLQNNGDDDLDILTNDSFTFDTSVADGSLYNLAVLTHPVAQTCSVTDGIGTISGADVTSSAVNCVADTTLPTIDVISPMDSDVDVALNVNVSAIFSEAMGATTITASSFTLYDDTAAAAVTGVVSYDNDSKTAVFNPDSNLIVGNAYTATVTTGATDLAHNALAANEVWSFTVIAPPVNTTTLNKISGCEFIDNGAATTNSTSITLGLSATDDVNVAAYYVTDNGTGVIPTAPTLDASGWVDITPTTNYSDSIAYSFENSYAEGERAFVYSWFKDEGGNVSGVASDAIRIKPNIFFEDFENGIGSWAASNGVWEVGTPTSGPSQAHSGSNGAATVLAANYPDGVDSTFESPSIELPAIAAGEEIHLRFWHWFSTNGYDALHVRVQEETAPGTWSAMTTLKTYRNNSGGVWTYPLIDLSAYSGKKVRVGFMMDNSYSCCSGGTGSGWYFDDITIITP